MNKSQINFIDGTLIEKGLYVLFARNEFCLDAFYAIVGDLKQMLHSLCFPYSPLGYAIANSVKFVARLKFMIVDAT